MGEKHFRYRDQHGEQPGGLCSWNRVSKEEWVVRNEVGEITGNQIL